MVLVAALLIFTHSAWAHDFSAVSNGDTFYFNITSSTAPYTVEVASFNNTSGSYSGNVTIPSSVTYNGITYSVTGIGNWAFFYCNNLTSVTIPNSVTSIGPSVFSNCRYLTSVTIPNSVTSIGVGAFSNCPSLTSITIPNSLTTIESSTFRLCTGLTSIIIPNSVTSIGWGAFEGDTSLTSVTIPNSVTSIGNYAFGQCRGLISITIPNSVTIIGDNAFSCCVGLTSITIPNSVTRIGEGLFDACIALTSITIPNSVTSIGDSAFRECFALASITIPNSVTSIGNWAFWGDSSLTSITFRRANTAINGDYVFYGVTSSIPVYIPCGSLGWYSNEMPNFSNFIEEIPYSYTISSQDTVKGTASTITAPTCSNNLVWTISATANTGYTFSHWSDGNTQNPRTLTVTQDTILIAFFTSNQGIAEAEGDAIRIYPNPASDKVTLEGIGNGADIFIINAMGKVVRRLENAGATITFSVADLPKGIYFVRVGNAVRKMVVE